MFLSVQLGKVFTIGEDGHLAHAFCVLNLQGSKIWIRNFSSSEILNPSFSFASLGLSLKRLPFGSVIMKVTLEVRNRDLNWGKLYEVLFEDGTHFTFDIRDITKTFRSVDVSYDYLTMMTSYTITSESYFIVDPCP